MAAMNKGPWTLTDLYLAWVYDPVYFVSSSWKHNNTQSLSSMHDSKLISKLEMSAEEKTTFQRPEAALLTTTEADPRAASSHKQTWTEY